MVTDREETRAIFKDDSLSTFLRRVYRDYAAGADGTAEFGLNMRVATLLSEAKAHCLARETPALDADLLARGMQRV